MSADVLREASALMRSRADIPLAGPWHVDPESHDFDYLGGPHVRFTSTDTNYSCSVAYGVWPENVEYIASWHPVVALKVADLLDVIAVEFEHGDHSEAWEPYEDALALATAYFTTT